jgi:hypothetical protein
MTAKTELKNLHIISVPEKRWRNTFFLFKKAAEMENGLKSQFVADFLYAFVG